MKYIITYLFFLLFSFTRVTIAAELKGDPPEKFLRLVVKEAIKSFTKRTTHIHQDDKSIRKYFDEPIAMLLIADKKCAEAEGLCELDFDPIIYAQDYDEKYPTKIDIKLVPKKIPTTYKVTFTNIAPRVILFELVDTKKGWRISDIKYETNWSLKGILSVKPVAKTDENKTSKSENKGKTR